MRVMCIYAAATANGRRNLAAGLASNTWGFKRYSDEYGLPVDWVVFGHHHRDGGPRGAGGLNNWINSQVDVILGQVNRPSYESQALHWGDELETRQVIYPYRFGFVPIASADGMSTNPAGPLGALSEGIFLSGVGAGRGVVVDVPDIAALRSAVHLPRDGRVDLSQTPGRVSMELPDDDVSRDEPTRAVRGFGRVNDVQKRIAIEQRAVEVAKAYLRQKGWDDIRDLGAPYDLVCVRPDREKHVEVKGTTSAGATVEFTPNEVRHFRECPQPGGADLIVVSDILIDMSSYTASGGALRHFAGYGAPSTDLLATRWQATLPVASSYPGS